MIRYSNETQNDLLEMYDTAGVSEHHHLAELRIDEVVMCISPAWVQSRGAASIIFPKLIRIIGSEICIMKS